ncbi:glycoside hydrolase family 88 protein [Geodermatophilus sp. SYSU D01186]
MSTAEFLAEAGRRVEEAVALGAPERTPHYVHNSAWALSEVATPSRWKGEFYDHGNWTAGFWAGMLLELHALGGPDRTETAARIAEAVRARADDGGTHDIGFLFQPSACLLHAVTGDPQWRDDGLRAADTLLRRYRPAGGYLQAFGALDDERSFGTSTVDTMMNLPLLWWAAEQTGRADFREAAIDHADATLRGIVRPDGSTYHLVRYGPDGEVRWQGTYQGVDDRSCWTRGQAWAVHGFLSAARVTGLDRFADAARRTLDFLWSRLEPTQLPPYDLVSPSPYRDSSAGAIVASALAEAGTDPTLREALGVEERLPVLLETLGREALFRDDVGLLAHAAYSVPHGLGVDGALPYGDYYYLRALRVRETGIV